MTMIDKIATNMREAIIFDVTENSMQMFRIYARIALETLKEPTEEMLNGARDWSVKKYDGRGIGNDAAIGCLESMIEAALKG